MPEFHFHSIATAGEKAAGGSNYAVTHETEGTIGTVRKTCRYDSWSAIDPEGNEVNSPGYGGYTRRHDAAAALRLHAADPTRYADEQALYDWSEDVWGEVCDVSSHRIALRGQTTVEAVGAVVAKAIADRFEVKVSPGTPSSGTCFIYISAVRSNLRKAVAA